MKKLSKIKLLYAEVNEIELEEESQSYPYRTRVLLVVADAKKSVEKMRQPLINLKKFFAHRTTSK